MLRIMYDSNCKAWNKRRDVVAGNMFSKRWILEKYTSYLGDITVFFCELGSDFNSYNPLRQSDWIQHKVKTHTFTWAKDTEANNWGSRAWFNCLNTVWVTRDDTLRYPYGTGRYYTDLQKTIPFWQGSWWAGRITLRCFQCCYTSVFRHWIVIPMSSFGDWLSSPQSRHLSPNQANHSLGSSDCIA